MFHKNDRALLIIRPITAVLCVLAGVFGGISALVLMAHEFFLGFVGLIISAFGAFWAYWLAELVFSAIVDLKLIRNRLYRQSNDNLAEFLVDNNPSQNNDTPL